MSDGVFHTRVAPHPPTAPRLQGAVVRAARLTRRLIFIFTMMFALNLPVSVTCATAAISHQEDHANTQVYAAWSCRGIYHVVRRGETIYSIARRYGTTAYRIAVCNGLASYPVYVGQTLLGPTGR